VNTCADWKMPIIDSFDVHYSKICWKLQERYICRFVYLYWVHFDRSCPLFNIVKFLKYFRNISWNISWNISGQKKSWNFTSLSVTELYVANYMKKVIYNTSHVSFFTKACKIQLEYNFSLLNHTFLRLVSYFPLHIETMKSAQAAWNSYMRTLSQAHKSQQ